MPAWKENHSCKIGKYYKRYSSATPYYKILRSGLVQSVNIIIKTKVKR